VSRPGKRMVRRVLELYREVDPRVAEHAAALGTTCREGCAHCCRLMVIVSFPEALAIVEHLAEQPLGPQRLAAVVVRGMEQWLRFAVGREELSPDAWFEEQIPCMFLVGNRCSVYAARPFTCRMHYVASPPEQCAGPGRQEVGKVDVRDAEQWFVGRVVNASQRDGVGGVVAPLPVMMHYALAFHLGGLAGFERALGEPPHPTADLAKWQGILLRLIDGLQEERA
jgi:Fe-S-cluster containining protein